MPDQPVELSAFLLVAEHAILQAPEGGDHEATEALKAAGCVYAPRLFAAIQVALKRHWPEHTNWGDVCGGCWTGGGGHPIWPCPPMVDLADALLGEEDQ